MTRPLPEAFGRQPLNEIPPTCISFWGPMRRIHRRPLWGPVRMSVPQNPSSVRPAGVSTEQENGMPHPPDAIYFRLLAQAAPVVALFRRIKVTLLILPTSIRLALTSEYVKSFCDSIRSVEMNGRQHPKDKEPTPISRRRTDDQLPFASSNDATLHDTPHAGLSEMWTSPLNKSAVPFRLTPMASECVVRAHLCIHSGH